MGKGFAMNRTLIWSLFLGVAFLPCVTAQVLEENAARESEQAGRFGEALAQYRAGLRKATQGSADEQRIRESIIRVAPRMSPRPRIPEEMRNRMIRGRTAFRLAKSPAGMKEAIDEFRLAVDAAPWLGEAYFNLALAYEKAENYPEAVRNYKLYLLTEPSERESAQVRDKVVELQYLDERTRKDVAGEKATIEERQHWTQVLQGLAGTWVGRDIRFQNFDRRYQILVRPPEIEITEMERLEGSRWWRINGGEERYAGRVDRERITGTVTLYQNRTRRPMTGTISADGQRIRLDFTHLSGPNLQEVPASTELVRR